MPPAPDPAEPDYRMSLAAERTYLAYVRTGLALLAAGVAVVGALPDAPHPTTRRVIGVLLIILGALVAGSARRRWRQIDVAMRAGSALPPSRSTLPLAAGIVVTAVLALVVVLV